MSDRVILGVDIAKRSKHGRYYAVVLRNEAEGTVERFQSISRFKLIRMIRRLQPDLIATDNIYEFSSEKRKDDGSLAEFLRELPSNTKVIQVTGGIKQQPLSRLVKRLNLKFNRFNPLDEANACALLAGAGVGDEVLFRKDKTQIKVSRARSIGKGGWSQKRYGRKIHAAVKERTDEICEFLRNNGIDFDLSVKKGFGGYVNAIFLVDATRDKIRLSSGRSGDVQVKISPVEREHIEFREQSELQPARKHTIVGIDPGTTTAVAILDLNGNLIELSSSRTRTPAKLIELIARTGKTLIVASDVNPAPGSVEKIKRSFNAILHEPPESLAVETKIALTKSFEYRNDHERDALAAALDAYRSREPKFEQIMKKIPPGVDPDEVKALVIKGSTIDAAISSVARANSADGTEQKIIGEETVDEEVLKLKSDLKEAYGRAKLLKNYVKELEEKLNEKEREIELLRLKIETARSHERKEVLREKELKKRDSEIKRLKGIIWEYKKENKELRSKIEELRQVRKREMRGEGIPLKIIEAFNKNAIMRVEEEYGIRAGDILLFMDASGGGESTVRMLAEIGIRAAIYFGKMSHTASDAFIELGIPAFKAEELDVRVTDEVALVDTNLFESAISKWNEEHGLKIKEKQKKWFDELVDEYRIAREKENR